MLVCEALCLSTQCVIFLRLKLKRELNLLLPTHVDGGAFAFEYSICGFLGAQAVELCSIFSSCK